MLREKIKYFFTLTVSIIVFFGCSLEKNEVITEKSSIEIIEIQKKLKKQEELLERVQSLIADQIILNSNLEQAIPPRDLLESLQNVSIELQKKSKLIEKQLSQIQRDMEKFENKKEEIETSEIDLTDSKMKIILGLISLQAGNPDDAKEYFQEIFLETKQSKIKGEILMAIGHSFLSHGHAKQAAAHYGIFLREYPNSPNVPQALYFLGVSMEKIGENKKKKVLWNDLIEKFPNSHFSERAKTILLKNIKKK